MARIDGNLLKPRGHSSNELFYCSAFIKGFSDQQAGRKFSYPPHGGPNPTARSAEIAYERGRHFSAIWGQRSIWNKSKMIEELERLHREGVII